MDEEFQAGFFLTGWYVFDNFAPFQFEWNGKLWPTSEHAYQAAHFFATNQDLSELIRAQMSPRDAAKLANKHKDQDDPEWSIKKLAVMEDICRTKLAQHDFIAKTLLDTGDKKIIEMNDADSFWGWGSDRNGLNHLGKIWMMLRDEIKET